MKGILVGLGKQSRGWFKGCAEHPGVELVGFVDTVREARERLRRRGRRARGAASSPRCPTPSRPAARSSSWT